MSDETVIFSCEHIGVAGTTPCHVKKRGNYFEARMGVAVMGTTNMDKAEFLNCSYNPFHHDFQDNYVVGKGITQGAAISAMKKDLKKLHELIWAF